jgi:hypothetical protein
MGKTAFSMQKKRPFGRKTLSKKRPFDVDFG